MIRRDYSERHREQRGRNRLVLFGLLAFCAVIYLSFIVRAGLFG